MIKKIKSISVIILTHVIAFLIPFIGGCVLGLLSYLITN